MNEPLEVAPTDPPPSEVPPSPSRGPRLPVAWTILAVTTGILVGGTCLAVRAARLHHPAALAQAPEPVGTIPARETELHAQHRYVGTLLPWQEARLGPQFLSGYLTEVKVRPGACVHRGDPLAVIEPELAKNRSIASAKQAEAIQARLEALAKESERIQGLERKGIVSVNDAENKLAEVRSEKAKLEAAQAEMASSDAEFRDSVQRAPFDGEIADRFLDPGAFVRPGNFILSVVDRSRVRCAGDAPEQDHPFLEVGRPVEINLMAESRRLEATITRVSPAADPATRTIHFEADLDNRDRTLPVGTTAEVLIREPRGRKVIQLPASAVKVEGDRATLFTVDGDRARKRVLPFLGEREGQVFLAPDLPPGAEVVLEGRTLLRDGDPVAAGPASSGAPPPGAQP